VIRREKRGLATAKMRLKNLITRFTAFVPKYVVAI